MRERENTMEFMCTWMGRRGGRLLVHLDIVECKHCTPSLSEALYRNRTLCRVPGLGSDSVRLDVSQGKHTHEHLGNG